MAMLNGDVKCFRSRWSRPTHVNGVLEFYSIFLSRDGSKPVLIYNSSELFEDHTLRSLSPGTAYTITLAVSAFLASHLIFFLAFTVAMLPSQACTGGGCTLSPPSQAHMEESSPENVPAPLVTPFSPHAFNVSWTLPHTPNGEKTSTWTAVPRCRALKLQKKTMFRIHFKYTRFMKILLMKQRVCVKEKTEYACVRNSPGKQEKSQTRRPKERERRTRQRSAEIM